MAMNPFPNKQFPKVSSCCGSNLGIYSGLKLEDTNYFCDTCRKPCDAVSDEGCLVDCNCHDGGYSIKGCECCIGNPNCKHPRYDAQCPDCGKYFDLEIDSKYRNLKFKIDYCKKLALSVLERDPNMTTPEIAYSQLEIIYKILNF